MSNSNSNANSYQKYNWFDSFLELNMHSTLPSTLIKYGKRYGVNPDSVPNYNVFMAELRKKKQEDSEMRKSRPKRCSECESKGRPERIYMTHNVAICNYVIGCHGYPNWIKEIMNTNMELFDELRQDSENSGISFNHARSFEDFVEQYNSHEEMLDRIGW